MKISFPLIPLAIATLTLPASAVIVAGASGGGNTANNTTRAQFESEYGISFPSYGNVINYSDASGIYLGHNSATKDVWVLTARHISTDATRGATVTIDGLGYARQADGGDGYGLLPGGDLRLVRYRRADLAVPTLPAVKISTTVPVASTALMMIGYGQNRTQDAATGASSPDSVSVTVGNGYNWAGTNVERWGTNQIEAEFPDFLEVPTAVSGTTGTFSLGPYNSIGYITDFDQPGPGQWLNSNESQGSPGDSGGSAFHYSGGEWILSGIYSGILGFDGQAGSTAAFGNLSVLTDVASYSSAIGTSLGGVTLIPEPAIPALLFLPCLTILTTRRRRVLV